MSASGERIRSRHMGHPGAGVSVAYTYVSGTYGVRCRSLGDKWCATQGDLYGLRTMDIYKYSSTTKDQ